MLNEARVVADVMPKSQLLAMSLDAKAKAMTLFGTEKVTMAIVSRPVDQ